MTTIISISEIIYPDSFMNAVESERNWITTKLKIELRHGQKA